MGAKRNRRLLIGARESGKAVRLHRVYEDSEWFDGIVLDVSADWVLLARVTDFRLDGWTAIRLNSIDEVTRTGHGGTIRRALELHGERPEPISVDLSSPAEIIRSFARRSPLVTIHREKQRPDACWIGRPERLTKKALFLLQVDPRATWFARPTRYTLASITRIEIDGFYERTLHELAGNPPVD